MKWALISLSLLSINATAEVECSGIPSIVYVGLHGAYPASETFFVGLPGKGTMPLGLSDDDKAKARFAMAQTAFIAQKKLMLKYYNHSSCAVAQAEYAVPTFSAITNN